MATQNIVDLPPHHPGMAELHRRVSNAFRVHWIKHPGKTPQKLVLNQKQAEDLALCRLYGASSMGSAYKVDKAKFNDRPIEVSDLTAGALVAHDGAEMPLADYEKMPTA